MSTDALVVLCTAPDSDAAAKLAIGLINARLAACVNIVPEMRSLYVWKGAVQSDEEVQLVIKTRRGLYERVEAWIRANHPYEVPEVLALDVARGSDSYLEWLRDQTLDP